MIRSLSLLTLSLVCLGAAEGGAVEKQPAPAPGGAPAAAASEWVGLVATATGTLVKATKLDLRMKADTVVPTEASTIKDASKLNGTTLAIGYAFVKGEGDKWVPNAEQLAAAQALAAGTKIVVVYKVNKKGQASIVSLATAP